MHPSLLSLIGLLCFSTPWLLICGATSTKSQIPKHYVVYMGASEPSINGDIESDSKAVSESAHLQLLSSIVPSQESERISIIHNYIHAFRGFSAMLTEDEASLLSGHREVVSVFADKKLELHTTRSWDFIEGKSGRLSRWAYDKHCPGDDVIIRIVDSGIWPELPSFSDEGFGPIPSRWKGECMEGPDFKKSNCNRKLIGARYYYNVPLDNNAAAGGLGGSPRDPMGHGTHVASTAGGSRVANASYFGLAKGTARGGSPAARIASYKVCTAEGCSGTTLLQAIDDAVKEGVDIISVSIGSNPENQPDYLSDPIAIGAFHAEQKGVMVICSAGNDGPDPFTVINTAPWVFTVAASSIDRDFRSAVQLGNGKLLKGVGIHFSNHTRSTAYPLVFGKDVAVNSSLTSEARKCRPGSLDTKKVIGKIVVCDEGNDPLKLRGFKRAAVKAAKGKGVIMLVEYDRLLPSVTGVFPYVEVGKIPGSQILTHIKSAKKPTGAILSTVEIQRAKPAPVVAIFSSRGPSSLTENILKPDVMAPGVAILAGILPKMKEAVGNKVSEFAFRSGTSMACPHVSGAAAFIKSVRRSWSSSMIRSALMTTATSQDNTRTPLTNSSNHIANPHEAGSGEINPIKALNPGLVFETTTRDYLLFLCYFGYSQKQMRLISNTKFECPKNSNNNELISRINYPSISIARLGRAKSQAIIRTVTNVGPSNSTYIAKVQSPEGLYVKVVPEKIVFAEGLNKKASFKVLFDGKAAPSGYNFGSVTWFDGRQSVRVVFAVNVE